MWWGERAACLGGGLCFEQSCRKYVKCYFVYFCRDYFLRSLHGKEIRLFLHFFSGYSYSLFDL